MPPHDVGSVTAGPRKVRCPGFAAAHIHGARRLILTRQRRTHSVPLPRHPQTSSSFAWFDIPTPVSPTAQMSVESFPSIARSELPPGAARPMFSRCQTRPFQRSTRGRPAGFAKPPTTQTSSRANAVTSLSDAPAGRCAGRWRRHSPRSSAVGPAHLVVADGPDIVTCHGCDRLELRVPPPCSERVKLPELLPIPVDDDRFRVGSRAAADGPHVGGRERRDITEWGNGGAARKHTPLQLCTSKRAARPAPSTGRRQSQASRRR